MFRVTAARKVAGRRYASTAVGTLNSHRVIVHSTEKLPTKPKEAVRVLARRMRKAEREERMDIHLAMTRPPTTEKSFTRPRDLRSIKRLPGGSLAEKEYEAPAYEAYEPYTVFLLESRYPVKHVEGITSLEHIVSVCREEDLPKVLRHFNDPDHPSCSAKAQMAMDNAAWPFLGKKPQKRVIWWEPGEKKDEVVARLVETSTDFEGDWTMPTFSVPSKSRSRAVPDLAVLSASRPSVRPAQRRAMHTSAPVRAEDEPDTSARDRANVKTSSWSKPPKPSQDADDNVVPTFYIERKKQRADISERKEAEGSLMAELNAGILSEGLAASVKTREEKIPVEIKLEDGTVLHASGFEPPTPEHEFHPTAAKQPPEDPEGILLTVKQLWDERDFEPSPEAPSIEIDPKVQAQYVKRLVQDILTPSDTPSADPTHNKVGPAGLFTPVAPAGAVSTPEGRATILTSAWDSPKRSASSSSDPEEVVPPYYIERKRQRDSISERKEEEGSLMAELNAGILSEDLAATVKTRPEKIPVEVTLADGTVRHPSGFEPPTPETDFHPAAAKPAEAPPKTPWTELTVNKPTDTRGFHSSAIARAVEVPGSSYLIPSLAVAPPPPIAPSQQTSQQKMLPQLLYELEDEASSTRPEKIKPGDRKAIRARYTPLLKEQPFWRPLMTITTTTRPLAMTLAHLWTSQDDRCSYVNKIELEDRRELPGYDSRIREMRVNRGRSLSINMAKLLAGYRGGIPGLRFSPNDKGRAVDGEGLADLVPKEKRQIQIGVAEWYKYAGEAKELCAAYAEEADVADGIETFGLDEHGLRTDGKVWRVAGPRSAANPDRLIEQREGIKISEIPIWKKRTKLNQLYEKHKDAVKPVVASSMKLRRVAM